MNVSENENARERLAPRELAVLLAAVALCRVLTWRACPLYDDAFITYRYARNFAEGHGLVFNAGAPWEPVLGTTTPLYGVLMGACAWLGLDLTWFARVFNVACDVGIAWFVASGLGLSRKSATWALCLFAALPWLARISAGGMESPLFALLALAAARDLAAGKPARAGLWAALDCTVRPEGVLLLAVCALELLRQPRALVRFAVPVALVGTVAVALLVHVYGSPVPQSVQAKAHMQAGTFERVLPILRYSFAPHVALLACLPLLALGYFTLLRRPGPLRPFVAFSLAITASYLAARPHVWGWYFYVPLTAWVITFACGAEVVFRRVPLVARVFSPLRASALVVAAVALTSGLRPSPVPAHVYAPLQAWARETSAREPGARILASDIGAIGWAWRGVVLDSEGLTWPAALDFGHPNAIVRAYAPEYLLIVAERERVAPVYGDPEILARYEPIARFAPSGARELAPPLDTLPPQWEQDYLVYRRKP
jgi:hypothetical protein